MAIKSIESYKNLCIDIEVQELMIEAIEREIKLLEKALKGPQDISGIDYSKQPGATMVPIGLDRIIERIQRRQFDMQLQQNILDVHIKAKQKIQSKLENLEGLDQQVVRLRDLEGKTLNEIAKQLGYSLDRIKQVSARNKRVV